MNNTIEYNTIQYLFTHATSTRSDKNSLKHGRRTWSYRCRFVGSTHSFPLSCLCTYQNIGPLTWCTCRSQHFTCLLLVFIRTRRGLVVCDLRVKSVGVSFTDCIMNCHVQCTGDIPRNIYTVDREQLPKAAHSCPSSINSPAEIWQSEWISWNKHNYYKLPLHQQAYLYFLISCI